MSQGEAAKLNRVSVSEVRTAVPTTTGVEAGMVTLREDEPPHRSVAIVIGQPEARAIQTGWTGAAARRPNTWDLFVSTVGLLEARIDRAVIVAVEEGRHFYANVEFERGAERRVLSARPSDAIALALRSYGAGLYVAEQVMIDLGLGQAPMDN
ncbi:MAG: bifunctional nuclease family protein [Acidimicrobiales bacterium]|nr:bifunctional nuclease family protein [Acidimicrobiales bacterium]